MKAKKKWRQLVWLQVVLISMSVYNLICCNVDEEKVESKKEMEAIGVATSGTDIDEYV